ncbi:hypothetical protein C0416_04345 [bacterium]|nr:hypothetical protein [bacterium]
MFKNKVFKNKDIQLKIFSGLSLILGLFLGYYLYTNITTFMEMRSDTASLRTLHSALQTTDKRLDAELENIKTGNEELVTTVAEELNYVFPETENHTLLTRTIESFSTEINRTKNPFLISNLQYLKPQTNEAGDFMILPFRMKIHSSHENFIKFLEYVENSGTLNEKTRLLDIKSIVINFVSPKGAQGNTSGKDEINFDVSMNSYFKSAK